MKLLILFISALVLDLSAKDANLADFLTNIDDVANREKISEAFSKKDKLALFVFKNKFLLVGFDKDGKEYYLSEKGIKENWPEFRGLNELFRVSNSTILSKEDMETVYSVRDGMAIALSTGTELKYFSDPIVLFAESVNGDVSGDFKKLAESMLNFCFQGARSNSFFSRYFTMSLGDGVVPHIQNNKYSELVKSIQRSVGSTDNNGVKN